MYSTDSRQTTSRRELRSFGLILAAGFLLIGLWPLIFRHQSPRTWALVISLVFGAAGLLAPGYLKTAHRIWMAIGGTLGWVNSRVIMSLVYYGMVTPIGGIMRIVGYDPMHRNFEPSNDTYRVIRQTRSAAHMSRQF